MDLANNSALERSVIRKISWRILPLIFFSYMIAIMDRGNISFAAVQMNASLGFSAAVYGLGAGLFFVGYSLFEIPSNLMLVRFGARRWIARIMLTWGLISGAMAFVQTPVQFYIMRFLLGVAEAGFYPGVMLYLSTWFPSAWLSRAVSRFFIALPISLMIMGSFAGFLLGMDGIWGLGGWQWMLLIEAIPAVIMAAVLLYFLPESPDKAIWLSADERKWIAHHHARDLASSGAPQHNFWQSITNPIVVSFGVMIALVFICNNGVNAFAPKMLMEATGWSVGKIGLSFALAQLPMLFGILLVCWHSDLRRQPHYHIAAMIALAIPSAIGMAYGFHGGLSLAPAIILISYSFFMATTIIAGTLGMPTASAMLHPTTRAVGFAAINTISQIGNFLGPALMGYAVTQSGSFQLGLSSIPLILLLPLALILLMRRYRPIPS